MHLGRQRLLVLLRLPLLGLAGQLPVLRQVALLLGALLLHPAVLLLLLAPPLLAPLLGRVQVVLLRELGGVALALLALRHLHTALLLDARVAVIDGLR